MARVTPGYNWVYPYPYLAYQTLSNLPNLVEPTELALFGGTEPN
jgi:hypothetical protein